MFNSDSYFAGPFAVYNAMHRCLAFWLCPGVAARGPSSSPGEIVPPRSLATAARYTKMNLAAAQESSVAAQRATAASGQTGMDDLDDILGGEF